MTRPDLMEEAVARALYAMIPTFQIVRRPTTETVLRYEEVRVDDTWEEAEDRHDECRQLARAAIEAMQPEIAAAEARGREEERKRWLDDLPKDARALAARWQSPGHHDHAMMAQDFAAAMAMGREEAAKIAESSIFPMAGMEPLEISAADNRGKRIAAAIRRGTP